MHFQGKCDVMKYFCSTSICHFSVANKSILHNIVINQRWMENFLFVFLEKYSEIHVLCTKTESV